MAPPPLRAAAPSATEPHKQSRRRAAGGRRHRGRSRVAARSRRPQSMVDDPGIEASADATWRAAAGAGADELVAVGMLMADGLLLSTDGELWGAADGELWGAGASC